MVGASTALHLVKRGRSVVLVDRRGAGEETSYGNTGIIQREGVVPYPFPRDIGLMAQYALNRRPEANLHWSALPKIAPWLYRYWQASTPAGLAASSRAARPLVERCIVEHEALMADAGILGMLRRTGYLRFHRSAAALEAELAEDQGNLQAYGVNYRALEPGRAGRGRAASAGPQGRRHPDARARQRGRPGRGREGLCAAVRGARRAVRGGRCAHAVEAARAAGRCAPPRGRSRPARWWWRWGRGRTISSARSGCRSRSASSAAITCTSRPQGNATLNRPIIDVANGYALTPMVKGIRLTTGAEFALRDAPATPGAALPRRAAGARDLPAGRARRCRAVAGAAAVPAGHAARSSAARRGRTGLWLNFGHHHLGFTLGPVTGRLLAELMTGEAPFTDPAPYRADRF